MSKSKPCMDIICNNLDQPATAHTQSLIAHERRRLKYCSPMARDKYYFVTNSDYYIIDKNNIMSKRAAKWNCKEK